MALDDLWTRLDARPGVRGRQLERICAWYLHSAPEYRRRFRKVWLWDEWPGAWAADAGIDLVAEEHGGGLWAIQAKAYDPAYAIKKADVDSFLAESSRPGFTYRLLLATTDRLGARARRTLDDQREPVGYLLRSQLELAPVAWPASPDDLRPGRPRADDGDAPRRPGRRAAVRSAVLPDTAKNSAFRSSAYPCFSGISKSAKIASTWQASTQASQSMQSPGPM